MTVRGTKQNQARRQRRRTASARASRSRAATGPSRAAPPQAGGRGRDRLAKAFTAIESFPALAEARSRALKLAGSRSGGRDDLERTIESDVGLTLVVLSAANRQSTSREIGSVPAAVEALGAEGVARAVLAAETYDFLDPSGRWGALPERLRRHSVAVRDAAERIAELARLPARDELIAAALLHDIGRPVLVRLYSEYASLAGDDALDPQERLRRERRELGIDHALVGAVLVRRMGAPQSVASAIERHHAADAKGAAAAIALADSVAHHVAGRVLDAEAFRAPARELGIAPRALRELLYALPAVTVERRRGGEPCPLSARELDALRGLAAGMVYKQIAVEMELSPSTVRTHLHNVYRKLGAADRAQAVLVARDRGWV